MTASPLATDTLVETESGRVTLVELPALKTRIEGVRSELEGKLENARSLRALAEDRQVELGELLIDNSTRWVASTETAPLIDQANSLRGRIAADKAALAAIHDKERHGMSGLVSRVGDWSKSRKVASDQESLHPQLRAVLAQIARSAPETLFDPATSVRAQALSALDQAEQMDKEVADASATLAAGEEEIKRRESSQREMGFDAPYLAAYLKTYGPGTIEGPLNLKRGERPLAVMTASLARQHTRTQWVGGSQGFSFPIGHTGIRYRVGSFHGQPIQQQVLVTLDSGSLEITDKRLAFIGRVKSTAVALEKVLHVECYSDALAVFREGRENPDFYLTDRPQYALFMLNWASAQS